MAAETMNSDALADAVADATVDAAEVERFSRLAGEWWDPRGEMAVLHKFNPVRLAYIRDAACPRFDPRPPPLRCPAGLPLPDIRCGRRLPCEAPGRVRAAPARVDARPAPIPGAHADP